MQVIGNNAPNYLSTATIPEQWRERRQHPLYRIVDIVHQHFKRLNKSRHGRADTRADILAAMIGQTFHLYECCPDDTPVAYDLERLAVIYEIARLSLDKMARDKAKLGGSNASQEVTRSSSRGLGGISP